MRASVEHLTSSIAVFRLAGSGDERVIRIGDSASDAHADDRQHKAKPARPLAKQPEVGRRAVTDDNEEWEAF